MSNSFDKLAEKIGVVVQSGGILNIGKLIVGEHQPLLHRRTDKNETTLIGLVRTEVYGRLREFKHSQLVVLDKALQPRLVSHPWAAEIKLGVEDCECLPEQTSLLDLFERKDIGGKFLILGSPGAGKTTTLVKLAKSLLEGPVEADPFSPIPVLLNISSWRNEEFSKWLSAELKDKHGISTSVGRKWIKEKKLLLLIDGLDELKADLQLPCIKAINAFLTGELRPEHMVVCCRSETYAQLKCRLHLNTAVRLGSLSPSQIKSYLCNIERSDFWSEASQDGSLLSTLSNPLMLSVISLTYPSISPTQLKKIKSAEGVPNFLWDIYIAKLLKSNVENKTYSKKDQPTTEDSYRWLIWVAKILEKESKTEFLIEKLQPTYLPSNLRRTYRWWLRVLKGLAGGIFFFVGSRLAGDILGSSDLQLFLLVFGFFVMVMSTVLGKEPMKISVSEALGWSWSRSCLGLFAGLIIFFLGRRVLNGLDDSWFKETDTRVGLSIVLVAGLMQGIVASEIDEKNLPNQGIRRTINVSLVRMVLIGVTFALMSGVAFYQTSGTVVGLIFGLASGIGISLAWLLFDISVPPKRQGSTENCVKHLLLRTILARNNFSPWNYAEFLSYASERVILQRAGGRYRFIHKQLQEHFASMPLDKF